MEPTEVDHKCSNPFYITVWFWTSNRTTTSGSRLIRIILGSRFLSSSLLFSLYLIYVLSTLIISGPSVRKKGIIRNENIG